MTTSRKHPSAAFWATVMMVVVLIGYPISFGPACWITSRLNATEIPVKVVYWPLAKAARLVPGVRELFLIYGSRFADGTRPVAHNVMWDDD